MKKTKNLKTKNNSTIINYLTPITKQYSPAKSIQKPILKIIDTTQFTKRANEKLIKSQQNNQIIHHVCKITKLNSLEGSGNKTNLKIIINKDNQRLMIKKIYCTQNPQNQQKFSMQTFSKKKIIELNSLNSFKNGNDNIIMDMLNTKIILDQIHAQQQTIEQTIYPKATTCNCKKSKCLKLYCQCFSKDSYCGQSCSCTKCQNNIANQQQRIQAKKSLLSKNSSYLKNLNQQTDIISKQVGSRGCNCQKSNCNKKYCLCYSTGMKCNSSCNCTQCLNKLQYNNKIDDIIYNTKQQQYSNGKYNNNELLLYNNNNNVFGDYTISKIFNRKQQTNIINNTINFNDLIMQQKSEQSQKIQHDHDL